MFGNRGVVVSHRLNSCCAYASEASVTDVFVTNNASQANKAKNPAFMRTPSTEPFRPKAVSTGGAVDEDRSGGDD